MPKTRKLSIIKKLVKQGPISQKLFNKVASRNWSVRQLVVCRPPVEKAERITPSRRCKLVAPTCSTTTNMGNNLEMVLYSSPNMMPVFIKNSSAFDVAIREEPEKQRSGLSSMNVHQGIDKIPKGFVATPGEQSMSELMLPPPMIFGSQSMTMKCTSSS